MTVPKTGSKNGDLGWFSRNNWGDKGRGVKKLENFIDAIYGWPTITFESKLKISMWAQCAGFMTTQSEDITHNPCLTHLMW